MWQQCKGKGYKEQGGTVRLMNKKGDKVVVFALLEAGDVTIRTKDDDGLHGSLC